MCSQDTVNIFGVFKNKNKKIYIGGSMSNPTKTKLEEKRMRKDRLSLRLSSLGIAIILCVALMVSLVGCATVKEPKEVWLQWPCPDCSGLGRYVGHDPVLYCTTCEDKGFITVYRTQEGAVICPDCGAINCRIDHEAERRRVVVEEPPVVEERPVVEPEVEVQRPREDRVTSYTVVRSNSLWRIAARPDIYGDGTRWREIYNANRGQIRDPNLIFPGQVLVIPR